MPQILIFLKLFNHHSPPPPPAKIALLRIKNVSFHPPTGKSPPPLSWEPYNCKLRHFVGPRASSFLSLLPAISFPISAKPIYSLYNSHRISQLTGRLQRNFNREPLSKEKGKIKIIISAPLSCLLLIASTFL